VKQAARIIGRGADRYAYHVKGLELSAYDPRAAHAAALSYVVSSRGGDFTSAYPRHETSMTPQEAEVSHGDRRAADRRSPIGKAAMVRRGSCVCAVLDSVGICKVAALSLVDEYDLRDEAELVTHLAGLAVTPEGLLLIGERILAAERLLNARYGAGPEDDRLPPVFLDKQLAGTGPGGTVDVQPMVAEFYALTRWSARGVPTAELLRDLGLGDWIDESEGRRESCRC